MNHQSFGGVDSTPAGSLGSPSKPLNGRNRIVSITFLPTINDVLCGKDKNCHSHPGNKTFRWLVASMVEPYLRAINKQEKMNITHTVVKAMKERFHARFLRKARTIEHGLLWQEISDGLARDKVSHAIRFAASRHQAASRLVLKQQGELGGRDTAGPKWTAHDDEQTIMAAMFERQKRILQGLQSEHHDKGATPSKSPVQEVSKSLEQPLGTTKPFCTIQES